MRLPILLICLLLLSVPVRAQTQPAPLEPARQAAALLPAFQGDLAQAQDWNRYTITATIDPRRQALDGQLQLEYTNRDTGSLDDIYMRLFPNLRDFAGRMEIRSVLIDGKPGKIAYEQQRSVLRIALPQRLAVGAQTSVLISFRTTTPANAGQRGYGAFNLQNSVLALASAYPIAVMVRNGVWDTVIADTRGDLVNSETALYDVTLTAPVDWTLVTTGVAIDGRLDAGQQTARFVSGPQRDFMIAAVKLPAVTGIVAGTRINAFHAPGDQAGGQAALRAATNALQVYNERFGQYPLAELDIVPVAAGTFLGVEYPGVVLIERKLYQNDRAMLETIIAHELAHQWWYSLVGNNVLREAWLDEGLATYAQVVYAEAIHGATAAEAELEQFRTSYRAARAAGRDTIVAQPNQKIRSYYTIVYAKAALFFAAMRNQIGDEAFSRFLQQYYASQRYNVASGAELIGAAEYACSCELDQLYRDWILTRANVALP